MTETTKWRDQWFRGLSVEGKLVWLYICDNCDCAGFWTVDVELAAFEIGIAPKKIASAIESLSTGINFKDGILWLIRFLEVQKNLPLSPACPAHKPIIDRLGLMRSFHPNIGLVLEGTRPNKGNDTLTIGYKYPIGKSKSIGNGNGKSNGSYSEDFLVFWEAYPKKTGKDKAFESWERRIDKPDLAVILSKIEQLSTTDQWTKDGGQYIPMPSTWLNQGRWADEPTKIGAGHGKSDADKRRDEKAAREFPEEGLHARTL